MAYQASRNNNAKNKQQERNIENNANNIRNAADVAIASKNPYGVAAGTTIKAADKLTGGRATKEMGKAMNKITQSSPMGRQLQKQSNKLNESGMSNKAGKIAALQNRFDKNRPNQIKKSNSEESLGGEDTDSLPSSLSSENKDKNKVENQPKLNIKSKKPTFSKREENTNDDKKDSTSTGFFDISKNVKIVVAIFAPAIFFILLLFVIIAFISNNTTDYEDAFGISYNTEGESIGIDFDASSPEQQAFLDRIKEVENEYLANGKTIDPIRIVAVYNILVNNKADIDYDSMDKTAMKEIADSMLNESYYDEEIFKNNLINTIFPKYLPDSSKTLRETMIEEVFEFVENYYELIEKEDDMGMDACSEAGSCTYSVKGFYIKGKGNISKKMDISNLYVRLMQCGTGNGHDYGGEFGKPLDGEELVPFEKYILGVAYQEIGPSAPAEAIKAQMVAARSYILARHVDMGGWRTLKKEGNRWVLQAAACTQDQVYCDPDKGCSSKDGQWSQVHSGSGHGTILKKALAKNSPLRTYANETSGEVLVNSKGNIVYSGYTSTEQNKMSTLAKNGLNYKQILLQVYNQGDRNYGATDISKASCTSKPSTNCATSTGEFARWKQMGAPWSKIAMGNSGQNIGQIGCLVTSISMLIAKSGVPTTIPNFNPGTFVQKLNKSGGFDSGGNFQWYSITSAAPKFKYQGQINVLGLSREEKLNKLKSLTSQPNVYVVAEVKGGYGQHWVAIDSVNGNTINMLDPGSNATNMWKQYNWERTSTYAYFRVS